MRRIRLGSEMSALNRCLKTVKPLVCQKQEGVCAPTTAKENVPKVSLLLTCQDEKGVSALHLAVFDGKLQLVRQLLNAHADPNLRDCHGQLGYEEGSVMSLPVSLKLPF